MPLRTAEIRPRRVMAFFAVLAIMMVIGTYVFTLALAAACIYVPYLILTNSDSPQTLVLLLFGIVIAGSIIWSLIPRRDKFTAPGMLLDRASHPRLFSEIDDIAAALNEPAPSEVYLIGQVNAFVADHGGLLGVGSKRVMGLGLPLFSLLTVSQLRAVLAHEFAHYYGGDTSLGPWVYKTKTAIIRIFKNIGSIGQLARIAILGVMYLVVTSILKGYFIMFLRMINFVSRRQEYRADELACLVAGRQPLIDGLRGIHRAGMAWIGYWNTEVAPVINLGSLPAIGDGFARFVSVPSISEAIEKNLQKEMEEGKTAPYDTHPPLRDRIAATEELNDCEVEQDTRPASSLLDDLRAAEMKFVEHQVPDVRAGALKYVSWDEVALQVTIPQWQQFATTYAALLKSVTASSIPDQVPKLREIGANIRDPKGMLLTPDQRAVRAGQLFATALALALIRAGWQLHVQPGVFQLRHGDQELNPFLSVNQILSGTLKQEEWASRCNQLGITNLALSLDSKDDEVQPLSIVAQRELFAPDAEHAS